MTTVFNIPIQQIRGVSWQDVQEEIRGDFTPRPHREPVSLREACETDIKQAMERIYRIARKYSSFPAGARGTRPVHDWKVATTGCEKCTNRDGFTCHADHCHSDACYCEDCNAPNVLHQTVAYEIAMAMAGGAKLCLDTNLQAFLHFAASEVDRFGSFQSPYHPSMRTLMRAFHLGVGVRKFDTQVHEATVTQVYNMVEPTRGNFTKTQFLGACALVRQNALCLKETMYVHPVRVRDLARCSKMSAWGVRAVLVSMTSGWSRDKNWQHSHIDWDKVAKLCALTGRRRKMAILNEMQRLIDEDLDRYSNHNPKKCLPKWDVCKLVHGDTPDNVFGSDLLTPYELSKLDVKSWRKLAPYFNDLGHHDKQDAVTGALRAQRAFGPQGAVRWMEMANKVVQSDRGEMPWHAATHWLPHNPYDGMGDWLIARFNPSQPTPTDVLYAVANGWSERMAGMSIREAYEKLLQEGYQGLLLPIDVVSAVTAATLSKEQAKEFGDNWVSRERRPYSAVPAPCASTGVRRLHDDDPHGPLLGLFTGCCQHPWSAAASSAIHGSTSPNGAFWVIERHGKIVAQSWVWRHGDSLCLDSLEIRHGHIDSATALKMMQEAARSVIGRLGITKVVGGSGYHDKPNPFPVKALDTPSGCYTDARSQTYIAGLTGGESCDEG